MGEEPVEGVPQTSYVSPAPSAGRVLPGHMQIFTSLVWCNQGKTRLLWAAAEVRHHNIGPPRHKSSPEATGVKWYRDRHDGRQNQGDLLRFSSSNEQILIDLGTNKQTNKHSFTFELGK